MSLWKLQLLTVVGKTHAKLIQELLRSNKEAQVTIIHVCCWVSDNRKSSAMIVGHYKVIIGIHFPPYQITLDRTLGSHLTAIPMRSF